MGGYNSGRYGWRGVIENRKRLDIRECVRRGWLRPGSAGSYSWRRDGASCGSVDYTVLDGALELRYTILSGDDEGKRVQVTIPIRILPWRFGGQRRYWLCPSCCRRCEIIAMASHGRGWACRRCLRLRYISQGLATADRLQRRADQLYARAGDDYGDSFVRKRKWLRWRTFNGLMDRANAASNAADAAFLWRLGRLGFFNEADVLAKVLGTDGS